MNAGLDSLFGNDAGEDPDAAAVTLSDDLNRVLRLPQRDAAQLAALIAEPLSSRLRAPGGTQSLRPLQALALAEAHDLRGLMALLPVGEGKTLITFLLPLLLEAARPVLLVPASLHDKTVRDFAKLREHWQSPAVPYTIVNYQLVSNRPELLNELAPDVIICDEVDALANPKAACTKRVYRYLRNNPSTTFCGLSGTVDDRSFKDWWHLQQWALPALCQPLPYSYVVMQAWAQALDEKLAARRPTGELWRFAGKPDATLEEVQDGFGALLCRTPGVITSSGSDVDATIEINCVDWQLPVITDAINFMRRTWCTPGGEEFSEPADLWRHARELANGFYYRWDPEPPLWWLLPRKEFHAFVRSVLGGSRTLDTMAQVVEKHADAVDVRNWYAVKDGYTPNTVPTWLCDDVLAYAVQWAQATNGIVWYEHRAVGERLQQLGLPCYGEGGLDGSGRSIDDSPAQPIGASALAVYRGFNLQDRWHDNLVLNCTPKGKHLEQLLGRTHRYGQQSSVVRATMLFTCDEQREGFAQARLDAARTQRITKQNQKLCFATYT